jgi:hypothetical protein
VGTCEHDSRYMDVDDCQGPGGRIHAIVIGVGKYSAPRKGRKSFDSLPGAALAAYRFARYLKHEFREPEGRSLATLRLMLSPMERDGDLTSLTAGPATSREVGIALQDWANDCNTDDQNLAILYVAGHGVALDKVVSTLFLADAPEQGNDYIGAINLSMTQDNMAGCAAKDNIFVYDCCAVGSDDMPDLTGAGGVFITSFPPGGKKREHSVFINAARVGRKTFALNENGTLLTRGLLGAYTDRVGEDALLRTAGDIIDDRFGITPYQLGVDINPKLRDILRSISHPDEKYEATLKGDLPVAHIAFPEPVPEFEVVLSDVLTGRTPPVKVWFEDYLTGQKRQPRDDAFDGQEIWLPAGEYVACVESKEGQNRYSCKLVKRRELSVKRREVEAPP